MNKAKKLQNETFTASLEFSDALIRTLKDPLIVLDKDLRVVMANRSFYEIFRTVKEETEHKLIYKLGNNQWDIPKLCNLLEKIIPKNTHFDNFEVEHTFPTIGKKIMLLNARKFYKDGEYLLLAIEDITKQKLLEAKLHESEQHYRWVVEQVKDHIIYMMDTKGHITDWNKAAEEITGYNREEVIGKHHSFIYLPEDKKKEVPAKELKTAENKGKAINERWHAGKNGILFWGSGLVIPIRNDAGKLMGFSKIMRDDTTHKEQEQRKDEFLRMASHELKTPITTLKAYTQILANRLKDSKDTKNAYFITNIDNQTNKLIALINDFLDMSKIEAGKLIYSKKKFDLDALIKKIVVDFQYMTETHEIKKIGEVKKMVTGDPDRIGQALINLLTNAIKYSPQAEKVIVRSKENTDSVTVSVQDFGMGMPKSKQPHIFDKYFQVTEEDEEGKKGFGLGLYITAEIIKRHGGKIWVESEKGKGSTFYFTLPLKHKGD